MAKIYYPLAISLFNSQAKYIYPIHTIIPIEPIKIHPSSFLNRISGWPPPCFGIIVSASVEVEAGFLVVVRSSWGVVV